MGITRAIFKSLGRIPVRRDTFIKMFVGRENAKNGQFD